MKRVVQFVLSVAITSYLFGSGCFFGGSSSDALFADPATVIVQ